MVGSSSLVDIHHQSDGDDIKCADIGYWLDKDHVGQGIVTKSCTKLIHYAFTTLNIEVARIITVVDNDNSIAVAKRLGFKLSNEKIDTKRRGCYCFYDNAKLRLYKLHASDCASAI